MYQQSVFPRWRGFNLLGMFCSTDSSYYDFRSPGFFREEEFKWIADWGFDFVRLPLSYRVWSDVSNPYEISEEKIAPLDEAVYWGEKYGLHVNIAMHRLPGYCINTDEKVEEKGNLWQGGEALEAAAYQWAQMARRYRGVSADRLSFNVINEPDKSMNLEQYQMVNARVIDEVRAITPDRLFILDGIAYGDIPPVNAMRDFENCGYSCRGYEPRSITHCGVGDNTQTPQWPITRTPDEKGNWAIHNKAELERFFGMWAALAGALKVGVHCGEMGIHFKCPHDVACRWLEDIMQALKGCNIGYAFWNLRGKFGIMDNGRNDTEMKDFHGHKLDEKMLKILQKY